MEVCSLNGTLKSMSFEKLNFPFVLHGSFPRGEGAKISSLARFGIDFP
jgi:hypothetical protein